VVLMQGKASIGKKELLWAMCCCFSLGYLVSPVGL